MNEAIAISTNEILNRNFLIRKSGAIFLRNSKEGTHLDNAACKDNTHGRGLLIKILENTEQNVLKDI